MRRRINDPHYFQQDSEFRTHRRAAIGAFAGSLLTACGSASKELAKPQLEENALDIFVTTASDANSDIKGRGAPLVLRIYELESEEAFSDADYFSLQDHDKETLGKDILKTDSWIMKPGESRNIRRPANPATRFIGVFAGYRDLPNATWRAVHPVAPAAQARWYRLFGTGKKTRITIRAQARGLLVTETEPESR